MRDSLSGNTPEDWDICTSARPDQVKKFFNKWRIIETGLKHGTVTIVLNNRPIEITTFRVDGYYSDNRRPDKVRFINDLRLDLSRRDLTINAMAYSPEKGLVDFFCGVKDLKNRVIRCVGNANERFKEDALRIMRALRFASVLDFTIEKETAMAICRNKGLLRYVSEERLAGELNKLIIGRGAGNILSSYVAVISEIIPEIKNMSGFEQNHRYRPSSTWRHTVKSIAEAPQNAVLRLAILLCGITESIYNVSYDISAPHFFNEYSQKNASTAKGILKRLKYDSKTVEMITQLVLYHETNIRPERKHIKSLLSSLGEERFRQLLEIKRANVMVRTENCPESELAISDKAVAEIDEAMALTDEIIDSEQCFSLKALAVNGRDLLTLGIYEGVEIGCALNHLLNMVIDEKIENDKMALMKTASAMEMCKWRRLAYSD